MRRVFFIACACALATFTVSPAWAHGTRAQGELELTVGWADEPALLGQPNAVQLIVERGGEPVEGAEDTLKVTVSIGDESTDPLALRTVFDAPGEYQADLVPTVIGGYTFRFTGTIDGTRIDESFTSPKDGFDEVAGTSEIAFPKQAPSTTELADKLAAVQRDAEAANDAVGTARVLAIAGIALANAGIALAIARRRA